MVSPASTRMLKLVARHGGADDGDDDSAGMAGMAMGSAAGASSSSSPSKMMADSFRAQADSTLWFSSYIPSNAGAVFGACVLLIFIGILTRFMDALHRSLVIKWANDAAAVKQQRGMRKVPFIARIDLVRGAFALVHAGFLYLLMLAVMTYNAYYFISVLIGLAIGEMAFGRFGRLPSSSVDHDHHHHRSDPNVDRPSSEITPLHVVDQVHTDNKGHDE